MSKKLDNLLVNIQRFKRGDLDWSAVEQSAEDTWHGMPPWAQWTICIVPVFTFCAGLLIGLAVS